MSNVAAPEMPNMSQVFESLSPMLLIFFLNWLKLDYTDPTTLLAVRVLFASAVIFQLVIYFLIHLRIEKKKEQLESQEVSFARPMNMSERMAASAEGNTDSHVMETTNFYLYDKDQLRTAVKTILTGLAITLFLHYKWQMGQVLILNAVMALRRFHDTPLFKIYFRNDRTIKRPFKTATQNPFASFLPDSMNPEKQAEELERRTKAAKKAAKKKD